MCEQHLPHSSATMATKPSLLCRTDIPETVSRNKSFLPQVVSARFPSQQREHSLGEKVVRFPCVCLLLLEGRNHALLFIPAPLVLNTNQQLHNVLTHQWSWDCARE